MPAELVEHIVALVVERVAAAAGGNGGPEPWIDVRAASEHIAATPSRIYALVSAGRIPHEKDGSRLLFRRSELDAWVRGGGGKRP